MRFEESLNYTIDLIFLQNYNILSLAPKHQKYKYVLSLIKGGDSFLF
jgi:hypothetical protein